MQTHVYLQNFGTDYAGDFVRDNLSSGQWTDFKCSVAFVKRSGVRLIETPLLQFSNYGHAEFIVGVDFGTTTEEGLASLLGLCNNSVVAWVYHDERGRTYHPKLYLFSNDTHASLALGSGNLTAGGLYLNYEAFSRVDFELSLPEDLAEFNVLQSQFQALRSTPMMCRPLSCDLLNELVKQGYVGTEGATDSPSSVIDAAAPPTIVGSSAQHGTLAARTNLFGRTSSFPQAILDVLASLRATTRQHGRPRPHSTTQGSVQLPVFLSGVSCTHTSFVMLLQNTDVGYGTLRQNRSPEVFIPIAAFDADPSFWQYPQAYAVDWTWNHAHPQSVGGYGSGKLRGLDGAFVFRGQSLPDAHFWYNPVKRDWRLANIELVRKSAVIDDLLVIERHVTTPTSYALRIVHQASTEYASFLPACSNAVPNSKKKWGYV